MYRNNTGFHTKGRAIKKEFIGGAKMTAWDGTFLKFKLASVTILFPQIPGSSNNYPSSNNTFTPPKKKKKKNDGSGSAGS